MFFCVCVCVRGSKILRLSQETRPHAAETAPLGLLTLSKLHILPRKLGEQSKLRREKMFIRALPRTLSVLRGGAEDSVAKGSNVSGLHSSKRKQEANKVNRFCKAVNVSLKKSASAPA